MRLFELFNFVPDDAPSHALPYFDDILDLNTSGFEQFVYYYANEHDMEEDEVNEQSPSFLAWLREFLNDNLEHAANIIQNYADFVDGKILIYREIRVEKNFLSVIRDRGLGEFWSWDKNAAEAHWGGEGNPVLMVSNASSEQIDWPVTLSQNADGSGFDEEREIRIKDGEKLPMDSLYMSVKGEWREIDVSSIDGELFPV